MIIKRKLFAKTKPGQLFRNIKYYLGRATNFNRKPVKEIAKEAVKSGQAADAVVLNPKKTFAEAAKNIMASPIDAAVGAGLVAAPIPGSAAVGSGIVIKQPIRKLLYDKSAEKLEEKIMKQGWYNKLVSTPDRKPSDWRKKRLERTKKKAEKAKEKDFSVSEISRNEALKILGKSGISAALDIKQKGLGRSLCDLAMGVLSGAAKKLQANDLARTGHPVPKEEIGNVYLEEVLKKYRYIEGMHYSVGEKSNAPINISMISGLFIVTVNKGEVSKKVDQEWYSHWKLKLGRKDAGRVIVYTHTIQKRSEFEYMLRGLMGIDEDINIYDKK